jgi:hypothetical protein
LTLAASCSRFNHRHFQSNDELILRAVLEEVQDTLSQISSIIPASPKSAMSHGIPKCKTAHIKENPLEDARLFPGVCRLHQPMDYITGLKDSKS